MFLEVGMEKKRECCPWNLSNSKMSQQLMTLFAKVSHEVASPTDEYFLYDSIVEYLNNINKLIL